VGLRLDWHGTRGFVAVACAVAVGVVAALACIPDLPVSGVELGVDAADAGAREAAPARCGDGVIQLADGEECDPGVVDDAGAGGCSADCKVLCEGGLAWSRNHHCYYEAPPAAGSLGTARVQCSGTHVVTFASEEELDAVVATLDAGTFWVGLEQAFNRYDTLGQLEPGWSPACSGCFAHTGDPTAPLPGPDAGCVVGSSDLSQDWQQENCTGNVGVDRPHVLCEHEPVGRLSAFCDGGICFDLVWTYGIKRYLYVSATASADDADSRCRAIGGKLVVLQSRDEREQLWNELGRLPAGIKAPSAIWIGLALRDGGSPGLASGWIWDDDASADAYPSPWGEREPRQSNSRRAYLLNFTGPPTILDQTLARDLLDVNLSYVCELPP